MFPSVIKARATKSPSHPQDGITVDCLDDGMTAELRMNSIEIRGSKIIGNALSLCLSAIRRNSFFIWTNPNFFLSNIFLSETAMVFNMSYHIKFTESFYKYFDHLTVNDGLLNLEEEIVFVNNGTHFGKTSCVWDMQLKDKQDQAMLDVQSLLVVTDKQSRAPIPVAQFFSDETTLPKLSNPPRYKVPTLPASGAQYTCTRTILEPYIDAYKHTNYKVYIWMTMECLAEAFKSNAFPVLGEHFSDLLQAKLSEFIIVYSGESQLGDVLKLSLWETEDQGACVTITKADNIINYTRISFS